MQDKEGGTYTPDTQEDEDSIGTSRLRPIGTAKTEQAPLTLIISGIFLVILLLLVVIFYNSKLSNSNRLPPELGAEVGAYKDKVIEAKPIKEDDLINTAASADASATKMAPDSQAPSSVTPTAATSQSAPPVVNATVAPEIQAALTPKTNPQPLPPVAPALKPAASTPTPKPVTVAVAPPKPIAVAPKPAPVAVAKPAPVVPKPAPVAVTAAPASSGGYFAQIGAFGSAEIANQQLASAQSQYGLTGVTKSVEKVEVNGKTYYRAKFGGFASKDKAQAFCAKLSSCIVKK